MLDTRMDPAVAKDMVKGAADPLHSEFRLSGPMLLNLTRLESWSPDTLLMRSFRQFQAERNAPAQLHKAALLRVSCLAFVSTCPASFTQRVGTPRCTCSALQGCPSEGEIPFLCFDACCKLCTVSFLSFCMAHPESLSQTTVVGPNPVLVGPFESMAAAGHF